MWLRLWVPHADHGTMSTWRHGPHHLGHMTQWPTATWHGPHHRGGSMTTWRRGPHHLSPVPLPGGVLQQPWSRLTEPTGPILSTWRRGSHLTEPAGPVSTRALYSGTVPRPGGTPHQRRPLQSRSHSTVLWATTEYNTALGLCVSIGPAIIFFSFAAQHHVRAAQQQQRRAAIERSQV